MPSESWMNFWLGILHKFVHIPTQLVFSRNLHGRKFFFLKRFRITKSWFVSWPKLTNAQLLSLKNQRIYICLWYEKGLESTCIWGCKPHFSLISPWFQISWPSMTSFSIILDLSSKNFQSNSSQLLKQATKSSPGVFSYSVVIYMISFQMLEMKSSCIDYWHKL